MKNRQLLIGLSLILFCTVLLISSCEWEDTDPPHVPSQINAAVVYTCDEVSVTNQNFILELRYAGLVYTFTPENSPHTLDVPHTEIEVRVVGEKNNMCPGVTINTLGIPLEGGEEYDDFLNIFQNTQYVGDFNETYCRIELDDKLLEPLANSGTWRFVAVDFGSGGPCNTINYPSIQVNLNYEE